MKKNGVVARQSLVDPGDQRGTTSSIADMPSSYYEMTSDDEVKKKQEREEEEEEDDDDFDRRIRGQKSQHKP